MKVIIAGAGAAGLMAAYDLTRKGFSVSMLEASPRIGGRIQTLTPEGFLHPVEAGAEFIHGDLALTKHLLAKAGQNTFPAEGRFVEFAGGRFTEYGKSKLWERFYKALAAQRRDSTVADFLSKNFPGETEMRQKVFDLAQGLDLADPERLSLMSVKQEWLGDQSQARPAAGYGKIVEYLADACGRRSFELHLNARVTKVDWKQNKVRVSTDAESFDCDAALLAIPHWKYLQGKISFIPEVSQLRHFEKVGFGSVIKGALEFEHPFWEHAQPGLGFLFMDDGFTFWTQLPGNSPVLTLWIGNAYAARWQEVADATIIEAALEKLQRAFPDKKTLRAAQIFRYTPKTETGGAYSWLMPGGKESIRMLNRGVGARVFFAGEALDPGFSVGTVEAALKSGRYAARKIATALRNN